MIKFGVAVVRGPHEVVPMTRLKVEEGASTALHVVADALQCTSVEAEERISRLEAFTSFAGESESENESEGEDRNLQSENKEESEVSGSESD